MQRRHQAPIRAFRYFRRLPQRDPSRSSSASSAIALLLALAILFATFSRASDLDTNFFYPSISPLFEIFYNYGRYISLGSMALAVVVAKLVCKKLQWTLVGSVFGVFLLNSYLLAKMAVYGNVEIFILGIPTLGLQLVSLVVVSSTINSHKGSIAFAAEIIFIYALFLVPINLYVAYRFPESTWIWHGRLFGITSNAQHLGMATALCVPALVYYIQHGSFRRPISIVLLAGCLLISFLTGSRAAASAILLAIAIPLLLGIVTARRRFVPVYLTVCAIFAVLIIETATGWLYFRFIDDREDSRSEAWSVGFEQFLANPLFGYEITAVAGRLYFIENTWIAAAGTGGLIAVLLSFFILCSITADTSRLRLINAPAPQRDAFVMYFAATTVIIWLSIFEAIFLGIFAAHTMILLVWLGGLQNAARKSRQFANQPVLRSRAPQNANMQYRRIHRNE